MKGDVFLDSVHLIWEDVMVLATCLFIGPSEVRATSGANLGRPLF